MPAATKVQYYTKVGNPKPLTAFDNLKIVSQLIAELMEKEKRTTSEMAILTKLLAEHKKDLEFITTSTKFNKRLEQLEKSVSSK